VLADSTPSFEKGVKGLSIEAAFQRENDLLFLDLKLCNKTTIDLKVIIFYFFSFFL